MPLADEVPVVACIDVGSPKAGGVGWAVMDGERIQTGNLLPELILTLSTFLREHRRIALGFECPLYVPVGRPVLAMTQCRVGEKLTWCVGAGATVLAIGLAQVHWVLSGLQKRADSKLKGTSRWDSWANGDCSLLLWEAYITQSEGFAAPAHVLQSSSPHERDAAAGAWAFQARMAQTSPMVSDFGEEEVLSLLGLQLLNTGLSDDLALLSDRCLVIKARKPHGEEPLK